MSAAALLATWFGIGRFRPAPGTWGSLAAVPLGWLIIRHTGVVGLLVSILAVFVVGVWAAGAYETTKGEHDSPEVVIDEVVGQWIAFIPLTVFSSTILAYGIGFMLFRVFDIWKPWPISWLDTHVSGGLGAMVDDVAAGIVAAVGLWLVQLFFKF